jgi:hypothetical protein
MVYACEHCGYTTVRKANFLRHKNRKNACGKTDNEGKIFPIGKNDADPNLHPFDPNLHPFDPNLHPFDPNVHFFDKVKQNVFLTEIKCQKCNKIFSNRSNLKRHDIICNGSKQRSECPRCKRCFSSYQSKCNHIRKNTCSPLSAINGAHDNATITNNTINNTTNNIIGTQNIIENQTIQFNVFGSEDLSYLLKDNGIIHRLRMYGKEGIYGLPKIIDDVHFNKERPENQTIIKPEEYGSTVLIKNDNNEWELREFDDVRDHMIDTIMKYFKAYNEVKKKLNIKLIEKKEKQFIKSISYELMALDGSIPKDLFQELNMDDNYVEDDDMEIRNKTRKFDKCTMHTIHNRTSTGYKKDNGSYIKK